MRKNTIDEYIDEYTKRADFLEMEMLRASDDYNRQMSNLEMKKARNLQDLVTSFGIGAGSEIEYSIPATVDKKISLDVKAPLVRTVTISRDYKHRRENRQDCVGLRGVVL